MKEIITLKKIEEKKKKKKMINQENKEDKLSSEVKTNLKTIKFFVLPDSNYFYDKLHKNSLKIDDYNFIDVKLNDNCGYRALALQ